MDDNYSPKIDDIDYIVDFWAMDQNLEKIRGILKEIADMCDPEKDEDL